MINTRVRRLVVAARLGAMVLVVAGALACGHKDPLLGSWTMNANGATVEATFNGDGTFEAKGNIAAGINVVEKGTWKVADNTLTEVTTKFDVTANDPKMQGIADMVKQSQSKSETLKMTWTDDDHLQLSLASPAGAKSPAPSIQLTRKK